MGTVSGMTPTGDLFDLRASSGTQGVRQLRRAAETPEDTTPHRILQNTDVKENTTGSKDAGL